jgi:hypothetical protein
MASQMASQVQVVDNSVRRWSAVAQSFYCTGNKGKALATPLFGLLGAGIGAALPTGRWHELYRAN